LHHKTLFLMGKSVAAAEAGTTFFVEQMPAGHLRQPHKGTPIFASHGALRNERHCHMTKFFDTVVPKVTAMRLGGRYRHLLLLVGRVDPPNQQPVGESERPFRRIYPPAISLSELTPRNNRTPRIGHALIQMFGAAADRS
jgi:hypothetical protein